MLIEALGPPRNARVLYVDMNAFFASIEQQDRPELRHKPVAVVSHLHPHATVLASSYEAKLSKVTTGTKLGEAKVRCPNIICIEPRPQRYRSVHKQMVAILASLFSPEEVEVRSIDEAAIFLARNHQESETARALAYSIKERFQIELGEHIRASIGIGPNSSLAKLATELEKPNGLVEITLERIEEVLASIPLTTLCGVGERMAAQLIRANIPDPLTFYHTPAEALQARFGIWGQYWWWRLHGYECSHIQEGQPLKSMSHEHVLPRRVTTLAELIPLVIKMADRLMYRLRRNEMQCRQIWMSLRLADAPRYSASRRFDAPLATHSTLLQAFTSMLAELPNHFAASVRKVSLGFGELTSLQNGTQLPLEATSALRSEALTQAVANLRTRYGFEVIQPATVLQVERAALKEQVGFGRIRDR